MWPIEASILYLPPRNRANVLALVGDSTSIKLFIIQISITDPPNFATHFFPDELHSCGIGGQAEVLIKIEFGLSFDSFPGNGLVIEEGVGADHCPVVGGKFFQRRKNLH